ncbi:MAG TPA: hypothetical protein DCZ92_05415 [Elusimicrobia bacterium]|nr:MAG: hypothetical protein A2016_12510 [Elusimicrobia bacterium GWF2_62_30]HBA60244.1 hypothetical protein [Elusimicrobiota bacterium]
MLREGTVFAQKIIEFYSDKNVECTVVDEHLSLLVTLAESGRTHEFRYGNRAFGKHTCWKKFYRVLEREWQTLETAAAPEQTGRRRPFRYWQVQDEAGEL